MSERGKTKSRFGCIKLVGLLIAVFFASLSLFGMFMNVLPLPKVQLDEETTHITEPLGESGLPDYAAYLQSKMKGDATTENNAAIPFWQAMWPGQLEDYQQTLLCRELGMEMPTTEFYRSESTDELRRDVSIWLGHTNQGETNRRYIDDDVADANVGMAMDRPWSADDLPPAAEMLERNRERLDLLLEAARRKEFYSPYPEMLDVGSNNGLINATIADAHVAREAARLLKMRAMYRIQKKEYERAWQDLRATYLIGRHIGKTPTMVGGLVAIALDAMAADGTQTLLSQEGLETKLAEQIFGELCSMSSSTDFATTMREGERMMMLDTITRLADGRWTFDNLTGNAAQAYEKKAKAYRLNWNIPLREANKWYDRMAASLEMQRADRLANADRTREKT